MSIVDFIDFPNVPVNTEVKYILSQPSRLLGVAGAWLNTSAARHRLLIIFQRAGVREFYVGSQFMDGGQQTEISAFVGANFCPWPDGTNPLTGLYIFTGESVYNFSIPNFIWPIGTEIIVLQDADTYTLGEFSLILERF